jgi:hypothetical protein
LLPLGWPSEVGEREAFTRVLLAAGADIERLLDAPSTSLDAFIRHAARMPLLRASHESPLIAFCPHSSSTHELLQQRAQLLQALPRLRNSICLIYLRACVRPDFMANVASQGGLFDARGALFTWDVTDGTLMLVSLETWVADLAARLEDLVATCPASGIMPIDSPGSSLDSGIATTQPSPPDADSDPFGEMPYAAVASRHMSPSPREFCPLPSPRTSLPPNGDAFRPISTLPPNPRLRQR